MPKAARIDGAGARIEPLKGEIGRRERVLTIGNSARAEAYARHAEGGAHRRSRSPY